MNPNDTILRSWYTKFKNRFTLLYSYCMVPRRHWTATEQSHVTTLKLLNGPILSPLIGVNQHRIKWQRGSQCHSCTVNMWTVVLRLYADIIIFYLLNQLRLIQLLWRCWGWFCSLLRWCPFKMMKGKKLTRQYKIINLLTPSIRVTSSGQENCWLSLWGIETIWKQNDDKIF